MTVKEVVRKVSGVSKYVITCDDETMYEGGRSDLKLSQYKGYDIGSIAFVRGTLLIDLDAVNGGEDNGQE